MTPRQAMMLIDGAACGGDVPNTEYLVALSTLRAVVTGTPSGAMAFPTRADMEALAATLPRPRIIYALDNVSPYLSRYYLTNRPTVPDGSEPFDDRGDPHADIVWPKGVGLYLHRFHRGDRERELHNHPFIWAVSFVLVGGYVEERRLGDEIIERHVRPGDVNYIGRADYHRVELHDGDCWSLFVAGPKENTWGFWDRNSGGYIPWRELFARERARLKQGPTP